MRYLGWAAQPEGAVSTQGLGEVWGDKVSLGGGSRSWCHLLGILEEEEEKYHVGFQRWWHTMAGACGHPL